MDRLTYRSPKFNSPVSHGACKDITCSAECDSCKINDLIAKLCAYEDTGMEPEDLKKAFNEAAILKLAAQALGTTPDHLRDLLQAEKNGRLVVLPSKTVWELTMDAGPDCDMKCPTDVWDEALGCDLCSKATQFAYERPCTQELLKELGKTVFLTRDEAEAALSGKGDDG